MSAGLGLGLLAKGPLILVLMGTPAFVWVVLYKEWGRVLILPWIGGLVLMLGISLPWYIAAEMKKTPGFMQYFFVGEHWSRYVVSNWAGDLYGSAHAKPYGTIWIQLGFVAIAMGFLSSSADSQARINAAIRGLPLALGAGNSHILYIRR